MIHCSRRQTLVSRQRKAIVNGAVVAQATNSATNRDVAGGTLAAKSVSDAESSGASDNRTGFA